MQHTHTHTHLVIGLLFPEEMLILETSELFAAHLQLLGLFFRRV